jgi:hypothetical protein
MSDVRYTVRRLGWHQAPHGDPYTRRLPTAEPLEHFDDFDAAEHRRRALEHAVRTGENPFRFGGAALYFQTSLDGPRLHDWLLDEGIDPPADQLRHRDWRAWWDAFAHTWTEHQLAHAWQALDKVRFFDVVEESTAEPFCVVSEIGFVSTGYHRQDAEREGGRFHSLYRGVLAATAACRRLNADRREETYDWWQYGYRHRLGYGEDPQDGGEAVYFEVIDVPGDVPPFAGVGFLVQRRAFDPNGFVCHDQNGRDTGSRVPVRLFGDRESAEAHRHELTAAARAVMNPFQAYAPPMSGLSEEEFAAAAASLHPPLPWPAGFSPRQWREWWDLCQDEVTDGQRAAAWELFADHPLFEVLPAEVRDG